MRKSSLWSKVIAFATAAILSALLLPATVIGWYFANPDSFAQALSVAADLTDPNSANYVWGSGR